MAHEIDIEVGKRVRAVRLLRGLTQSDLGVATGVQFQQIQKYEIGKNRISCSSIALIAQVLDVPVADFFTGLPKASHGAKDAEDKPKGLPNLWRDPKAAAILAAIDKLGEQQRKAFLALLFEMAKETT